MRCVGFPKFGLTPTDSRQLNSTAYVSSTAVSPNGDYLAFGDADGVIHLLSTNAGEDGLHHPFNGFDGQPIEWADAPQPLPDIRWHDST
jgi:PAB-dependent poly(A)-specific ribonuclease subunit 2